MGRKRDAHGDARGSGTLRDGVSGEMPSQCSVVRPPDELKQPGAASPNTPSPKGRGTCSGSSLSTSKKPKTRVRHDGWTDARRRVFLRALSETGCVADACRWARISTTSAYRKRSGDDAFARSWDRAIAKAMPTIEQAAYERGVLGWEEPIVAGGKVIGTRRRYSDSLLRLLLVRGDMAGSGSSTSLETSGGVGAGGSGGAGGDAAQPHEAVGAGESGTFQIPKLREVGPWHDLVGPNGERIDAKSPVGQAWLAAEATRDGRAHLSDGSGNWYRSVRTGQIEYSSQLEAKKEVLRRLDNIAAAQRAAGLARGEPVDDPDWVPDPDMPLVHPASL